MSISLALQINIDGLLKKIFRTFEKECIRIRENIEYRFFSSIFSEYSILQRVKFQDKWQYQLMQRYRCMLSPEEIGVNKNIFADLATKMLINFFL